MNVLLRFRQMVKAFFGRYEALFLALAKFAVAFLFFRWINQNMGYLPQLTPLYVPLVLALICCLMPPAITVFFGFALIALHSYGIGIETAGFVLVLLLLMVIFFLRFSAGSSIVLALTPVSFTFGIPVILPMGSGLLAPAASALPAGCGVILYYFIRYLAVQQTTLSSLDVEPVEKLKLMTDGIVLNWGMWITVVAFVLVILMVNLLRTRSFDFAWHIAIIFGGFVYIVVMIAGSNYLDATVDLTYLVASTVVAAVICFLLEFLFFGGNYLRSERLQFEDDDYIYFVKAVPKIPTPDPKRSVKKINAEPPKAAPKPEQAPATYANPIFHGDEVPQEDDLEKKLERSLQDL